jgi:hypothetical protein
MISKPFVFVSSTSSLTEERHELRRALPSIYEVYLYEEDRARRASPEQHCRRQIQRADVFLGVLGPDYGSAFPGEDRSIVEWEHNLAMGRPDLDMLGFVKEIGRSEVRDPRQQAFIDRISQFRGGVWRRTYRTSSELVADARTSLEQWLAEFFTAFRDRRAVLRRVLTFPLTALPVASVLGLVGIAASSTASRLTTNSMIGLCLTVEAIVALCGVGLLWVSGGSHE